MQDCCAAGRAVARCRFPSRHYPRDNFEPMRNLIQQGLALRELLRERILILDGAMGTMLQQVDLTADGFRRPASRGLQRESGDSPGPTWSSPFTGNISKPARTSSKRTPSAARRIVLAEYGLGDHALGNQPRGGGACAPGRRRILHFRETALRRGLDGSNHESHQRHRRHHVSTELRKNFLRSGARAA